MVVLVGPEIWLLMEKQKEMLYSCIFSWPISVSRTLLLRIADPDPSCGDNVIPDPFVSFDSFINGANIANNFVSSFRQLFKKHDLMIMIM